MGGLEDGALIPDIGARCHSQSAHLGGQGI